MRRDVGDEVRTGSRAAADPLRNHRQRGGRIMGADEDAKKKANGKPRFFSIGGRATVLGINQRIGDSRVALVGGGIATGVA